MADKGALKPTTVKEAIKHWEEKNGQKASEAQHVSLINQFPPIEKMDASLASLINCEKLSLSTNAIEKISNLSGLQRLKTLSIGRNNLKKLEQLEPVADTLEQLWCSYNNVEKLNGVQCLKKLKILYMSNNKVKDWAEVEKLSDLTHLQELQLFNNPIELKHREDGTYRTEVLRRLPQLHKLDGVVVEDDERPGRNSVSVADSRS
eukprot:TRINITY_DN35644_c0_g1_i1.p1 TRINITY_DN35644_c0_g1~~TRINITY_DN35644_c0_g1_i1.p1  ORF type:complete len:205 (+),score=31.64 TRINITY_DN35644_c0_g1_i1:80-694(+)